MYQRIAPVYALILYQLLTARYAWCDNDGATLHDGCIPLASLTGVIVSFFKWMACDGMLTVAHHLHLTRPPQKEQVPECTIAATTYLHMQTSAHVVRQKSSQLSTARVVMHIGYHRQTVALVKTHRVVIVVIEERALLAFHEGVIFLALLL